MQRMHQSYKCMKAHQKKLSGCASNLLATNTQGNLRKPIIGIYKPSSIMKNSHQYMKETTYETLYHEDHGAISNHKCGKRILALSLLSLFLSYFFYLGLFSFLWPLFFFISSGVSSRLMGESQSPSSFPRWDNALIMMIITLLFTYNSILRTKYDST